MKIPNGGMSFVVQGMDTRNGKTCNVLGTQLYVVLPP